MSFAVLGLTSCRKCGRSLRDNEYGICNDCERKKKYLLRSYVQRAWLYFSYKSRFSLCSKTTVSKTVEGSASLSILTKQKEQKIWSYVKLVRKHYAKRK